MEDLAPKHGRLAVLSKFLNEHQPFVQDCADNARMGNLVRTVYTDQVGSERGFDFILGAGGEPRTHRDFNPVSCYAPFGKAFLNQSVGVTVRARRHGREIEFEVIGIELPPEADIPLYGSELESKRPRLQAVG